MIRNMLGCIIFILGPLGIMYKPQRYEKLTYYDTDTSKMVELNRTEELDTKYMYKLSHLSFIFSGIMLCYFIITIKRKRK